MMTKGFQAGLLFTGLLFFATVTVQAGNVRCWSPSTISGKAPTRVPCDVTFSSSATYLCNGPLPQTGTYTLRNNSPVAMKINYARIKVNDASPVSDTTITSNTCGSSLPRGGSCTITVSLATDGPFSRVLQVGINSRQVELVSPLITPTSGCDVPSVPSGSFPCALNSTSTFASLAGTSITNTGPTVLNGDLGLSPGTAVIGFPPGIVTGSQQITNATAATAQNDLTTLYTCLAAQPCTTVIGTADQASNTLTSSGVGAVNVYCSGSTILNSGVLTLNGDATSVFIFQAGSSLTLNPSASIVLTGGATARNVFWQVGSSATLGTSSVFRGTIAAFSSITMNTGATMSGRALARNAAVTFDTNSISLP